MPFLSSVGLLAVRPAALGTLKIGSQNRHREPLWRLLDLSWWLWPANKKPRAPQERPKSATRRFWSDFPPVPVSDRYPTGIQGVSEGPNFARLDPWRQTIIKEMEYKQLKHRI